MNLHELDAVSARAAIGAGEISAEALVRDCLARIAATEDRIKAWTWLDPDHALAQARAADRKQKQGEPLGPLHGLPVGVKDIFDTADMPTENGTVLHAGRRPAEDATAVARLRQAGAVIMGKTVTTELAVYAPGKTTNPHDARHTPGGSSSGSAAAVAAKMVPLALGTQTNGSLIRPASYCGVVGYKPSHGLIPRHGVLKQSPSLDHVGAFARTVEDIALVAGALAGHDGKDPAVPRDARLDPGGDWMAGLRLPPRIAFARSPVWDHTTETARAAFAELSDRWREFMREVPLPAGFDTAHALHRTIMEADLANSYGELYARGRDQLSGTLREMIERGQTTAAVDYSRALDGIVELNRALEPLFADYDAIATPATTGEAPAGLEFTGSPMFCTLWTLCGVPAISLPLLKGKDDLPIGVQLVGRKGDDARLLRLARWLVDRRDPAR
jgi:Asp-tRNA(Asn)/Glu-tRNA(Gln) amidotransferase A subunit family amidase